MTVETSDEFDECMLNRQNFSYQNFALRKFWYCIFYGYNLLTWVYHVMSGHGILKYFCPITHKMYAPEDKDPPEGKELPNLFGSYISKVIPSSSWSIASCNADVTRVLKQAKRSFTKNCYTKLTPAQRWEIYKLSTLVSTLQFHNNLFLPTRTKPITQFVSFAHQTFWHVSFVKFRQTFPPSKFYAIWYGFVWIIFLNVSLLYTIFYLKQTAHVNASNLFCFKLKYSYCNILVPTCNFLSFLWGNIFEFDAYSYHQIIDKTKTHFTFCSRSTLFAIKSYFLGGVK